jgi:2-dehydro-3-deoxygalactonokinase
MQVDWIAVDWGTSNVRAWAMGPGGVQARAGSDQGMARVAPGGFPAALDALIGGWPAAPVIACGMVGARQGWVEAPYAAIPGPALPFGLIRAPGPRDVRIIPGLRQDRPADVMRGEETQIAGFLALNPGWDGVLCLPGTHCKWVQVSAGEVVSFATFMTGELFAALSTQTVLRHSVAAEGWDDAAFAEALADALSRPERAFARLFGLRAEALLHGLTGAAARARLSGLLIGAELAGARPYWLGQQVGIIGAGKVARIYAGALTLQGVPATVADGEAVTLAGLTAAWEREAR